MGSKRCAGLLFPLFAMSRRGDHGIGDLQALCEWIAWADAQQLAFLQLLPINALGSDFSPYSALSSVALEPVYACLDKDWMFGLIETPNAAVKDPKRVDYRQVRSFKMQWLKQAYQNAKQPQHRQLWQQFGEWFAQQGEWLDQYCCYLILAHHYNSELWWQWPQQQPEMCSRWARQQSQEYQFHAWTQWLLDRQWQRAADFARKHQVELMGDIPIGVAYASADVFFNRHLFRTQWSGGAPAEGHFCQDPFTAKWGQNWGVPLYDWEAQSAQNFAWWRQRVAGLERYFSLLRVDHILGFYRFYAFPWKPWQNSLYIELDLAQAAALNEGRLPGFVERDDSSVENRILNLKQGDYLLNSIFKHSRLKIIAEDLGCTPEYVAPHLKLLGMAGFIIPHWNCNMMDRAISGSMYQNLSVATYATHDHPPLSLQWLYNLQDIANAGSRQKEAAERQLRLLGEFSAVNIRANNKALHGSTAQPYRQWDAELKHAMFNALFECNSDYVVLMYNDLFDIPQCINIPGTVSQLNWSLRYPATAAEAPQEQGQWLRGLIENSARVVALD